MNVRQTSKGFTIIEVVLVLAIAGLIFLMVFIALPALQSSQRDTARKNDVSTVASAVTTYTSNNRGTFPTTSSIAGYVTSVSTNTTTVTVQSAGSTSAVVSDGTIVITPGTTCGSTGAANTKDSQGANSGTQTLVKASSTRQFTVSTYLEAGGGTTYCQDS
jgi:prepilin-type N-terminal cleavage/methylation domain-containing protein